MFYLFICLLHLFISFRQNQESPVAMLQSFGHWMTLLGLGRRKAVLQPACTEIYTTIACDQDEKCAICWQEGWVWNSNWTVTFHKCHTYVSHIFHNALFFYIFYHDFLPYFSPMSWRNALAAWPARLQCDHLLWACLPSPLPGSLRVPGWFRYGRWTPR